ncbi:tau-stichotoxin-Hcr2c-like [Anoplophora glabripennis]|uniref:tau-stichotoxin-Hcr2c-like n=1 Tax=Anoplophora glabripennis TaxID=217634 RepID=UPI0008747FA9|nr:tau-stichotoxin-Hcr2c-like [Anoplophora glabripennis]
MFPISKFFVNLLLIFLALQIFSVSCFSVEDCLKDTQEGPELCEAYIKVFKWDDDLKKCEPAIYGGCYATSNNFETIEQCQNIAEPVCAK